ncbi:MAG: acyl carrier protein [bacterium]
MEALKNNVKSFILQEFLPGENPEALTESTPLISGGILDSISTLKLVMHLEQQYHVKIQSREVNARYMDTIADIAKLVQEKSENKS